MSNFLNKVKSEFNKGVSVVSTKSKGMLEIAKINSQINSLQAQKGKVLEDLGSAVYNMYSADAMNMEKINAMCREISSLDASIEEKREQIKKIQEEEQETLSKLKSPTCSCGETINEGSLFCSKCGSKVQIDRPDVNNDTASICECGAKIKTNSKFCGKCGKQIMGEE